jgi:hypothetical protein
MSDPVTTPPPSPAAAPTPTPAPESESAEARRAREQDERIARLEASNHDNLVARIVAESGIPAGAREFLTASDEAGLRAQAEKLKAIAPTTPSAPAAPPPIGAVGSVTNPGGGAPPPTMDEKIAAAEKGTSRYSSLELKLQKLRGE